MIKHHTDCHCLVCRLRRAEAENVNLRRIAAYAKRYRDVSYTTDEEGDAAAEQLDAALDARKP